MLNIHVNILPESQDELKYLFNFFFEKLLEQEFRLDFKLSDKISIELPNFKLVFESAFFQMQFHERYTHNQIPRNIDDSTISIGQKYYPIVNLYGNKVIDISASEICMHSDILASSFFMLTRWEESVLKEKDSLGRFKAEESLMVKHRLWKRCIVNEYIEIFWALLQKGGFIAKRKEVKFEAFVTHDIDLIKKFRSPLDILRSFKEVVKKSSILQIPSYCIKYVLSNNDPYDNIEYISESTHTRRLKAIFYFKTGVTHTLYDRNLYNTKDLISTFQLLEERDQEIGIHPSFETFEDQKVLNSEILKLKEDTDRSIKHSRQHYLRFKVPETWRLLSNCDIETDSSMMYTRYQGFRNGICQPFRVFDFEKRKLLAITELPLMFMETSILNKADNEILDTAKNLIDEVSKYNGQFVMVWHNSNLVYARDRNLYESILDYLVEVKRA